MKISEQQAGYNANTRDRWKSFENHRQHTTQFICDAIKYLPLTWSEPTIAVLGAGNGNDLELETIAESFSKIHLFDFDPTALEYLKAQQLGGALSNTVVVEPPVDLSGISAQLDDLPENQTEPWALELGEKTRQVKDVLPDQQFDVVVSTCLTTQLLAGIVNSLGDDSPFKDFMLIAIRDGHLKLMEKLIRPGGAGVLITDFVSSDTLPELATIDDAPETVLATARKAIDQRNFFTGTNPWAMKDALAKLISEDPFEPWSIAPPWRWQIGEKRSYLVTAINFSKPLAK